MLTPDTDAIAKALEGHGITSVNQLAPLVRISRPTIYNATTPGARVRPRTAEAIAKALGGPVKSFYRPARPHAATERWDAALRTAVKARDDQQQALRQTVALAASDGVPVNHIRHLTGMSWRTVKCIAEGAS
jgi:hypothetical protein